MRNFEVFNSTGDGLTILLEIKEGEVINMFSGDTYHDKINEYIEGYISGIKEYTEVSLFEYWTEVDSELDFDRNVELGKQEEYQY